MKKILIAGTVCVLLLIFFANSGEAEDYSEFAQCLTESGAVMYGVSWCSHCNMQKDDFGSGFSHINYVECSEEKDLCINEGIESFPTWIIEEQKYTGRQQFERLSVLTGCELKRR